MSIERHFTVSIYIVHKDKVLLHLHKKYKIVLPLGGHIEENELPEEACIREAKEESGLNINLYNSEKNKLLKDSSELAVEKILINPMHTVLCEVNSEHYHIDLVYYATAKFFETIPGSGESNLLKWFDKEDFIKYGEILSRRIKELYSKQPQCIGFCNGDFHRGNIIKTLEDGVAFFDFDACGIGCNMLDIAVYCDRTNYFNLHETKILETQKVKGYGKKITAMTIDELRKIGINEILIVCQKSNIASKRIIENNGGVLEKEENEHCFYWVRG